MEFFIDTADVEAIRKANDMGFISGVTTNPSLIAKEGKDFHATIKEIASIVDGPISAEVLADDAPVGGHYHGTHHGIGLCLLCSVACQLQAPCHVSLVGSEHGCWHLQVSQSL